VFSPAPSLHDHPNVEKLPSECLFFQEEEGLWGLIWGGFFFYNIILGYSDFLGIGSDFSLDLRYDRL
jgi:hypothetical protein